MLQLRRGDGPWWPVLFWTALANTCVFVGVGAPLSIAVSLGTALLVHARLTRARGAFRTALFSPVVTTVVDCGESLLGAIGLG